MISFGLRTRSRRGQAAVEFALVLPFLLVMLIGIVEFGRAWNLHQVITDAARETARKAAIADGSTEAQIRLVAANALSAAGIDPSNATVTLTDWDAPGGSPLTVGIDLPYQFTFFGPLVKWTTGESNIVLKTSFTMRNE